MSHDAREWVWEHSRSKGTARMVLTLIADRCIDGRCIAYASVTALMKRANASRTAVRDALDKLIADGELVQIPDRRGPRGETYYCLPMAARALADQSVDEGPVTDPSKGQIPTPGGSVTDPSGGPTAGPESDPGGHNPAPGGAGIRTLGGTDSGPQNRREPKANGSSSSSAAPIPVDAWQIDDDARAWLQRDGHLDRLGEAALHTADMKWRAYRATSQPRSAAAWAADWRAWISRERAPQPGRRASYGPPGNPSPAPPRGMTRAQAHTAALLAALERNGSRTK
ncbi:helix-turn-helix domain-containing protein [Streptomyces sp. NPDC020731]|uniref:helix-turn-helix domain-containing protein n=1 Tax=Streptomyces sp. NPDC020731 TaxID=3365085 RepID=UPI0037B73B88